MKRMHPAALLSAVALLGCGGALSAATGGPCTITLTGARTGTYDCSAARSAAWQSSGNQTGVGLNVPGDPIISVSVVFSGEAHTGVFHSTDSGVEGGAAVTRSNGTEAWEASVDPQSGSVGSFTLNLTAVSVTTMSTSGKVYTAHGTVDATLPASAGSSATGVVTLHAAF